MEKRAGEEDIYEVLKESGCLPVPSGMQCPYCKVNYFEGDMLKIRRKMSAHMESTHLIRNNNQTLNILLNILLNIYGSDWWIDFISKHKTRDINFHEREIGYCKITEC
jgi:hypothetical protein